MEGLSALGCQNEEDYNGNYADVLSKIDKFEGLVIRSRIPVDRQLLDRAVNLKFIARVGAGLENIDSDYAAEKGIVLMAAPEGNRNAVGEHSLGLLLGLMNKICKGNDEIRQGIWDREGNRGFQLDGNTIGIIGYGNTGKAFARKLSGFDVEVLCYDIVPGLGDNNAQQVSLQELEQRTTVLSLHIPLTPLTDGMVNSEFFKRFTHPLWLLNTSRGKCVVTRDLVSALKNGKVLGAGLDVLEYEKASFEFLSGDPHMAAPEPLQYLLDAPNVLLTPHVAGWTHESKRLLAQTIVDKVAAGFF